MIPNHPTIPVSYTGGDLDRAATLRKDREWLRALLAQAGTLVVPIWRERVFVDASANASIAAPPEARTSVLEASAETVFLGLRGDAALFVADLSGCEEGEAVLLAQCGEPVELRKVLNVVAPRDASVLAYARAILHWHRHHRYCSLCGHTTESEWGGHMRRCSRASCGHEWYPATSPAVIMLVERRAPDGRRQCLLARHAGLARGVYSTVAGFVEPGESLEEAVAREVLEETGIRVGRVAYQASQPWPFPSSIMLGFRAEAASTEITIDRDELDEARWFTDDEVRGFGDWGDETVALRLPRKDSIARSLVDAWLADR